MDEYAIIIKKRGYGVIFKSYTVSEGITKAVKAFALRLSSCFRAGGRFKEPAKGRRLTMGYVASGEDWA